MRSGFKSCALEPLLTGLCIDMMHAVASYLCRGIEEVITGLTRNQFVDNTTRGFESLPLRQIKGTLLASVPFIWRSRSVTNPARVASEGSHMRYAHICVARSRKLCFAHSGTKSINIPRAAYPSRVGHSLRVSLLFGASFS